MKVVWSRNALADRERIWLFLAERTIPYADKVEARLRSRCDSLADLPRQRRPIGGDRLRELSVTDIQYVVLYRIEDDAVRILRVHSSRENRGAP